MVSIFLLSMFNKIYQNMKNIKQINNDKFPKFYLPSFNVKVNVKVLPLGWNTQDKPADYKFCDIDDCLLPNYMDLSSRIVLIYGYGFHQECLSTLLNGKC